MIECLNFSLSLLNMVLCLQTFDRLSKKDNTLDTKVLSSDKFTLNAKEDKRHIKETCCERLGPWMFFIEPLLITSWLDKRILGWVIHFINVFGHGQKNTLDNLFKRDTKIPSIWNSFTSIKAFFLTTVKVNWTFKRISNNFSPKLETRIKDVNEIDEHVIVLPCVQLI